jgi:hypothetical protein
LKENELNKQYTFTISDTPISFGRSGATIEVNHTFLSKKQCLLEYDKLFKLWKITDGCDGKKSTHGTWYECLMNL